MNVSVLHSALQPRRLVYESLSRLHSLSLPRNAASRPRPSIPTLLKRTISHTTETGTSTSTSTRSSPRPNRPGPPKPSAPSTRPRPPAPPSTVTKTSAPHQPDAPQPTPPAQPAFSWKRPLARLSRRSKVTVLVAVAGFALLELAWYGGLWRSYRARSTFEVEPYDERQGAKQRARERWKPAG